MEWGTPVLYLRPADGRVFDAAAATVTAPPSSPRPSQPDQRQNRAGGSEVEALCDRALASFWTERWDDAVDLLRQVLIYQRDHPGATAKLTHAHRQQRLATRYAEACAAADAQDCDQATAGYAIVVDADPGYRDAAVRLEGARRQPR